MHRLCAERGEVDDRKACVCESDSPFQLFPNALIVGTTVQDRISHAMEVGFEDVEPLVGVIYDSGNPAHRRWQSYGGCIDLASWNEVSRAALYLQAQVLLKKLHVMYRLEAAREGFVV